MAHKVPSKKTTVETFQPRLTSARRFDAQDWDVLGLPALGAAFESRRTAWNEQFAEGQFVVPKFRRRPNRPKSRPKLTLTYAPESSGYWCGGIAIPEVGDRMEWVEGQWSAPQVALPADADSGQSYILSSWVGMDGDYGSDDVLQAGCDATVVLVNGITQHQCQPWWQWYPGQSQTIDGVAISPGDLINCKIVVTPGSSSSARIVFSNLTTGRHCAFGVTSPTLGIALAGRSAEWIVEAFGTLGPIARFSTVEFDNCYSGTLNGETISAGQGTTIQMMAPSGAIAASASLSGPASVRIT